MKFKRLACPSINKSSTHLTLPPSPQQKIQEFKAKKWEFQYKEMTYFFNLDDFKKSVEQRVSPFTIELLWKGSGCRYHYLDELPIDQSIDVDMVLELSNDGQKLTPQEFKQAKKEIKNLARGPLYKFSDFNDGYMCLCQVIDLVSKTGLLDIGIRNFGSNFQLGPTVYGLEANEKKYIFHQTLTQLHLQDRVYWISHNAKLTPGLLRKIWTYPWNIVQPTLVDRLLLFELTHHSAKAISGVAFEQIKNRPWFQRAGRHAIFEYVSESAINLSPELRNKMLSTSIRFLSNWIMPVKRTDVSYKKNPHDVLSTMAAYINLKLNSGTVSLDEKRKLYEDFHVEACRVIALHKLARHPDIISDQDVQTRLKLILLEDTWPEGIGREASNIAKMLLDIPKALPFGPRIVKPLVQEDSSESSSMTHSPRSPNQWSKKDHREEAKIRKDCFVSKECSEIKEHNIEGHFSIKHYIPLIYSIEKKVNSKKEPKDIQDEVTRFIDQTVKLNQLNFVVKQRKYVDKIVDVLATLKEKKELMQRLSPFIFQPLIDQVNVGNQQVNTALLDLCEEYDIQRHKNRDYVKELNQLVNQCINIEFPNVPRHTELYKDIQEIQRLEAIAQKNGFQILPLLLVSQLIYGLRPLIGYSAGTTITFGLTCYTVFTFLSWVNVCQQLDKNILPTFFEKEQPPLKGESMLVKQANEYLN